MKLSLHQVTSVDQFHRPDLYDAIESMVEQLEEVAFQNNRFVEPPVKLGKQERPEWLVPPPQKKKKMTEV